MLYVIMGEDIPGSLDQRLAARPEHLARLQALLDHPPVASPAWSAPDVATAVLEEARALLRGEP